MSYINSYQKWKTEKKQNTDNGLCLAEKHDIILKILNEMHLIQSETLNPSNHAHFTINGFSALHIIITMTITK